MIDWSALITDDQLIWDVHELQSPVQPRTPSLQVPEHWVNIAAQSLTKQTGAFCGEKRTTDVEGSNWTAGWRPDQSNAQQKLYLPSSSPKTCLLHSSTLGTRVVQAFSHPSTGKRGKLWAPDPLTVEGYLVKHNQIPYCWHICSIKTLKGSSGPLSRIRGIILAEDKLTWHRQGDWWWRLSP